MSHDNPLRAERDEAVVHIGEAAVVVAYDPDGEAWFVRTSSVPGLAAQADAYEELMEMLPLLILRAELP